MICTSCHAEKHADDFYSSSRTKCKECIKAKSRSNRLKKIDHYREYDRSRSLNPERVAARDAYANTERGKARALAAKRRWAENNIDRRQAHSKLSYALRSGAIKEQPCFICGKKAEAHHPDYSLPLLVTWLCPQHHKDAHRAAAEILYSAGERETLHF